MKDHPELYNFPNSNYCKLNRNSRSGGKSVLLEEVFRSVTEVKL